MKKKIIISIIVIISLVIVFIIGMGKKNGVLLCTSTMIEDDVTIVTTYEVSYKDRIVTKLHSVEEIESDDSELLTNYRLLLESMYEPYVDLKYYSNKIIMKKDSLASITNVDYTKIDINKFKSIDSTNENLFDNGKIKIGKVRDMYEETGARCREKR